MLDDSETHSDETSSFHELNSLSLVRLLKSSTFGPGLTPLYKTTDQFRYDLMMS